METLWREVFFTPLLLTTPTSQLHSEATDIVGWTRPAASLPNVIVNQIRSKNELESWLIRHDSFLSCLLLPTPGYVFVPWPCGFFSTAVLQVFQLVPVFSAETWAQRCWFDSEAIFKAVAQWHWTAPLLSVCPPLSASCSPFIMQLFGLQCAVMNFEANFLKLEGNLVVFITAEDWIALLFSFYKHSNKAQAPSGGKHRSIFIQVLCLNIKLFIFSLMIFIWTKQYLFV